MTSISCTFPCSGTLNPAEKQFADYLESHKKDNPGKPLEERTLEEIRAGPSVLLKYTGEAAKVSYQDVQIPAKDGTPLSLRVYNNHLPDMSPVFVYYPGCAFLFDLFEINNIISSRIAQHLNVKVILAQYRLAPEVPISTSLQDSYDMAEYIAKNPSQFGIDSNRIILGGWCSGAHAATVTSYLAAQNGSFNIVHQILLSGRFDLAESNHEFDEYEKEDKTVSRDFIRYITSKYYGISKDEYQDPLLSPYYLTNFQGFPPTTILCGEYDALRNDSEGYFLKLKEANVKADKIILTGQTHNTIMMRSVLSDGPDPAEVIARIIQNL